MTLTRVFSRKETALHLTLLTLDTSDFIANTSDCVWFLPKIKQRLKSLRNSFLLSFLPPLFRSKLNYMLLWNSLPLLSKQEALESHHNFIHWPLVWMLSIWRQVILYGVKWMLCVSVSMCADESATIFLRWMLDVHHFILLERLYMIHILSFTVYSKARYDNSNYLQAMEAICATKFLLAAIIKPRWSHQLWSNSLMLCTHCCHVSLFRCLEPRYLQTVIQATYIYIYIYIESKESQFLWFASLSL